MSFETDIYSIMNSDPSLNAMADRIDYKRIKKGTNELENDVIIYTYKKIEAENSRSGMNFLTNWTLGIYVGSASNKNMTQISNRVQEYLENYKGGNISLIYFEDDDPDYDEDENIHFNDMYFNVTYQN